MKVLVALDRSAQSATVLAKALEMVKQSKAECILYSLAEEIPHFGEGADLGPPEFIQRETEKTLAAALDKAKAEGVQAKTVMASGDSPANGILDTAESEGVDLIITGSRAKTGLDRFLLGSVAAKVVDHAKCSVLVVR